MNRSTVPSVGELKETGQDCGMPEGHAARHVPPASRPCRVQLEAVVPVARTRHWLNPSRSGYVVPPGAELTTRPGRSSTRVTPSSSETRPIRMVPVERVSSTVPG